MMIMRLFWRLVAGILEVKTPNNCLYCTARLESRRPLHLVIWQMAQVSHSEVMICMIPHDRHGGAAGAHDLWQALS